MISISDNYLEDKDFFALQNALFSEGFPMYYIPKVAYENDNSLRRRVFSYTGITWLQHQRHMQYREKCRRGCSFSTASQSVWCDLGYLVHSTWNILGCCKQKYAQTPNWMCETRFLCHQLPIIYNIPYGMDNILRLQEK